MIRLLRICISAFEELDEHRSENIRQPGRDLDLPGHVTSHWGEYLRVVECRCEKTRLAPPTMTSVGTVTEAHFLSVAGLPLMVSPMIAPSYGIVCATASNCGHIGDGSHLGNHFGRNEYRIGHEVLDCFAPATFRNELIEMWDVILTALEDDCCR